MFRRAPLFFSVLFSQLLLGLACGRVADRVDGDIGGPDDPGEDEVLPTPDSPVVFYVTWNQEGETWPEDMDDEAGMCPPGSTHVGGNGWATACLGDSTGATYVISNTARETYPEDVDDPAEICPSGWDFVGGQSYYSTCLNSDGKGSYDIFYGPNGEDSAEGLDACGENQGLGYGYYGSAVCEVKGQRGVVIIAVDAQGRTSEDVEPAELCADGWEFVGTSWYGVTVCTGPVGTTISLGRDTQGRTYPEELDSSAELCPEGWQALGSYYGNEYCFTEERLTVAVLTRDAQGRSWPEDVDQEGELCPEGWTHLGGVGYGPVCAR